MRNFYLLTFLLVWCFSAAGQIIPPDGESTGDQVIYRKEMQGGAHIHSNGIGAFFRSGRHLTGRTMRFLEAEITNIKHPKSFRPFNPFEESGRRYVYGKTHSFFVTRGGIGLNNVIHGKDRRRGVEVRYHYFAGPSIGFAKPVYLEILIIEPNTQQRRTVTEKYDPERHTLDNIYGKAPFTRGVGETVINPGAYGKFGVSFEYSGYDDYVKAIETGFFIDAFSRPVHMMAFSPPNRLFVNFYISFVIGKREFY
jgi:hypothetical protein